MTGPEHYLAAEECLAEAAKAHANSSMPLADRSAWLMEAQVHATLAQAAATALGNATETDRTDWRLAMRGD